MLDGRGMIVELMPPQHPNEGPIKEMAVKLLAAKADLEEVMEEGFGERHLATPPNVLPMKREGWVI